MHSASPSVACGVLGLEFRVQSLGFEGHLLSASPGVECRVQRTLALGIAGACGCGPGVLMDLGYGFFGSSHSTSRRHTDQVYDDIRWEGIEENVER